jgi:hypothetical protein
MKKRINEKKIGKEPGYFYYNAEKVATRSEIIEGEIYYHIKFKGQSEFQALFNSKTVKDVLLSQPEIITEEEYHKY